jgi:chaperonin cofactor prefoldin
MMVDKELLELVRRLSASGRTEPEIIGQLRAAGFKPAEIDAAMKAILKERIERPAMQATPRQLPGPPRALAPPPPAFAPVGPPARMAARPVPQGLPPEAAEVPEHLRPIEIPGAPRFSPAQVQPATKQAQPPPARPQAPAPGMPSVPVSPTYRTAGPGPEITVDEIVEQILAENMKKLEARLAAIDKRDTQLETQLAEARKLLEEARGIDARLDRTMASHMEEFKDFLSTFEARISALEKAFRSLSEYMKK